MTLVTEFSPCCHEPSGHIIPSLEFFSSLLNFAILTVIPAARKLFQNFIPLLFRNFFIISIVCLFRTRLQSFALIPEMSFTLLPFEHSDP